MSARALVEDHTNLRVLLYRDKNGTLNLID